VVAAGDVARWPNALFDETMRVEHWTHAVEQANHAARRLLAGPDAAEPFSPVPYFWTDQYDVKIQFAGRVRGDDDVRVIEGSAKDRKLVALYGRQGRVTGVLAWNRPPALIQYRRKIARGLGWDEALAAASA
jgi:3-phenylpropionate/trans-cinnamate dioxygenase ferredoxin reductase subunit